MKKISPFQVEFVNDDRGGNKIRISITVGNLNVISYPQPISSHFRDLIANRYFLSKKSLEKFFFGEEPIFGIEYLNDNLMRAYVFNKKKTPKKVVGYFLYHDALRILDNVIEDICNDSDSSLLDKKKILDEVEQDIHAGVYDVYLIGENRSITR